MTTFHFLYGPLCHGDLQDIVLENQPMSYPMTLRGYQLYQGPNALPVIGSAKGALTDGVLVSLSPKAIARLNLFQGLFGALPVCVTVDTDGGPRSVTVHVAKTETTSDLPHWSDSDWTVRHQSVLCRASTEIMAIADTHPSEALQARWTMALSHAASVERGRQEEAPACLRASWTRADVRLEDHTQPYAWFFGVCEEDLRFRRFDGTLGKPVKRAAFLMSDAVTVLPYDPVRDHVLLIEQFRFGPWLRGAQNCWTLEPIAGRVDPFESPEDCALREAREEARLDLNRDRLLSVANAYPSPGAATEFLYQYVAICDLPTGIEGIAGLESEAEDIRSHLVSFERLMTLIEEGEVQNGPLILTAYWLAVRRAGLRARLAV